MRTIKNNVSNFKTRPLFGIIGGMGPLSSAQFLHSIYKSCSNQFATEQDYPRIMMISDPIIPDRTTAIRENKAHLVTSAFEKKIARLSLLGVNEIIIACITAHVFLDQLDNKAKNQVTDIVKLLYNDLDKQTEKTLILSSVVIHEHQVIKHRKAIYPTKDEVQVVHDFIFKIKLNCSNDIIRQFIQWVNKLAFKYQINSVLFACTELHLAHVFIQNQAIEVPYKIIDPLQIAANYIIQKNKQTLIDAH